MPLEPSTMSPDRSLLLDTFLKLILCHGSNVAQWKRSDELASNPELTSLLKAASDDLASASEARFPSPEVFECEQYGSKARYLVQKLNPDVPMLEFLQGLYKAIVA